MVEAKIALKLVLKVRPEKRSIHVYVVNQAARQINSAAAGDDYFEYYLMLS